jgi:hypothetical protein
LVATKRGYVDGAFRKRSPEDSAAALELLPGLREADIELRVWKHGVISGQLIDESGESIVGAEVTILRRQLVGGRVEYARTASGISDDRGLYRAVSLVPGDYIAAVSSVRATYSGFGVPEFSPDVTFRATIQAGNVAVGQSNNLPVKESTTGQLMVIPPTFFPDVRQPTDAAVLSIRSGEERRADFTLRTTAARAITGRLIGFGEAVRLAAVRVIIKDSGAVRSYAALEVAATVASQDGTFRLEGVPSGRYELRVWKRPELSSRNSVLELDRALNDMRAARAESPPVGRPKPAPTAPTLWAAYDVTVAERNVDIEVRLVAAPRVSGRFVFNGTAPVPDADQYRRCVVRVLPASGRAPELALPGPVDIAGSFTTHGVPAGRYVVVPSCDFAGWHLDGVWHGGKDISAAPVDLVDGDLADVVVRFVDKAAILSGAVSAATGGPAKDATVLVFPQDSALWQDYGPSPRRLIKSRVTTGRFEIPSIPAGDYLIGAVPDELAADWPSPSLLTRVKARATPISVRTGQSSTHHLVVLR